jgi:hypothetical protein
MGAKKTGLVIFSLPIFMVSIHVMDGRILSLFVIETT